MSQELRRAAEVLRSARALLIGAGAGMGVDSGLPDFRGTQGFWRAYPAYAKLGLDFASMANPQWFDRDPEFAWGFYGHRLGLYRATTPHPGFALLRTWASRMPHGAFVFTSNVDGQFQKAGFPEERVAEVHGSIHFVQCLGSCAEIASAAPYSVDVDPQTFRARPPLPTCQRCGSLVRPNILMFGDWGWNESRSEAQQQRLMQWLESVAPGTLAVVECGAGTAIPSVRRFCESAAAARKGTLIRINVREPQVPAGGIGLPLRALEALSGIAEELERE
ncbi:Sir2 family NAD-dependent protein deacetylase [Vitiosangium sp. GDMCC 1.1324]|uniref:SIR2 family NAD-dependent protein deacylase n=1 Tax=Vitiosangium sp. (strain GDMCC 1.1324) TaxID=2138576 RepID=UPI000D3A18BC|nr:Sir2 family NAD-dependent protein deacetylase [Vitiosangium sp. GDMCC 1.1324]PTL79893.1 NAD-dependent protein deacetylase [Vitiosangium sp. GDMCC 1.1324]